MRRFFVQLHIAENEEDRANFAEKNGGDAHNLVVSAADSGDDGQNRADVVNNCLVLQRLSVDDHPVIIVAIVQEITYTVANAIGRESADLD